jgi:hypothetical protein
VCGSLTITLTTAWQPGGASDVVVRVRAVGRGARRGGVPAQPGVRADGRTGREEDAPPADRRLGGDRQLGFRWLTVALP